MDLQFTISPGSHILMVGINEQKQQMYVMFLSGKQFLYSGLTKDLLRRAAHEDSFGRFFNSTIRGLYEGEEVKWNIKSASNDEIVDIWEKVRLKNNG